jgi:hypothetical protein
VRYSRHIGLLLLLLIAASARKRDPLTEAEADQIRHAALEPHTRLKLFIKFTDVRVNTMDQLRSDPKAADGRGAKMREVLEDFTALLDEINDNLDQYQGRPLTKDDRKDFRKGLSEVVTACGQWEQKLKTLHTSVENDPGLGKDSRDFKFALKDAEDALESTTALAREYSEIKDVDDKPAKKK